MSSDPSDGTAGLQNIAMMIRQSYDAYIAESLKRRPMLGAFTPTPEEVEQKRKKHEARKTRNRARWQHVRDWAYDQPTIALIDLHEPDDYTDYQRACQGCSAEVSGYDYELNDWPCQSFLIIEKAMVDQSGY